MDIEEILALSPKEAIKQLKRKSGNIPSWEDLEKQYDTKLHPVNDKKLYPDKVKKGHVEKVTRITLGLQKLAVRRMSELLFTIPVERHYNAQSDREKQMADVMEAIFNKNRIDCVNLERARNLYAACENVTLWYSQEVPTFYNGIEAKYKLRCKNYSPKDGTKLYPLFDEYDDMVALSVEYVREEGDKKVTYLDTYTATKHIRYKTVEGNTEEELNENIEIGKIAGIYIGRSTPVWEDQSENVYEAEWTLSRNGNYIRKNSRPNWVIFSDKNVQIGKENGNENEGRNVLRYGKDDKAQYVTWQQSMEAIKYQIDEIKKNFFMELQLPDMSMENMKATPMSGEARKMMFIDAQLKVGDESGPWLEFLDREVNVVKAFMKKMFPGYEKEIDNLQVENVITAYNINDDAERISNLSNATGGKQIMSQRTAIKNLGYVDDVEQEMKDITEENAVDMFDEPSL